MSATLETVPPLKGLPYVFFRKNWTDKKTVARVERRLAARKVIYNSVMVKYLENWKVFAAYAYTLHKLFDIPLSGQSKVDQHLEYFYTLHEYGNQDLDMLEPNGFIYQVMQGDVTRPRDIAVDRFTQNESEKLAKIFLLLKKNPHNQQKFYRLILSSMKTGNIVPLEELSSKTLYNFWLMLPLITEPSDWELYKGMPHKYLEGMNLTLLQAESLTR